MNRSPNAWLVLAVLCSCSKSQEDVERWKNESALIVPAECTAFAPSGKVDICHATGSIKNPFVDIRVDSQGCINGHSNHPNDFIDLTQSGSCANVACLPFGAPCVPTGQQCCSGACDTTTATPTCACSQAFGSCAIDADCCGGAVCINGTCFPGA